MGEENKSDPVGGYIVNIREACHTASLLFWHPVLMNRNDFLSYYYRQTRIFEKNKCIIFKKILTNVAMPVILFIVATNVILFQLKFNN